jgi:hypothetical protein
MQGIFSPKDICYAPGNIETVNLNVPKNEYNYLSSVKSDNTDSKEKFEPYSIKFQKAPGTSSINPRAKNSPLDPMIG